MKDERLEERIDEVRRKLLRASAVAGGSMVLGHLAYQKPAWKSFFGVRSAWAQPTSFLSLTLQNRLGIGAPGTPENTGQDCWQIASGAGATWNITATPDMNLQPEIFLYAPGAVAPFAGTTNLLTGTPFGLAAAAVGAPVGGTVMLGVTGTYTLCIEDERSGVNQVAGDYTITVTSDRPMGAPVTGPMMPFIDEGPESEGPSTPPV